MKQIPEEILTKALELQESGRTAEQVFAVFPEVKGELMEYFRIAADLRAQATLIPPPSKESLREALRRAGALRDIPAMVAKPVSAGFFDRLPFGFRVMAPVMAVLLIVALAGFSEVAAPGPVGQMGDEGSALPASETVRQMEVSVYGTRQNIPADTLSRPQPAATMSKSPAGARLEAQFPPQPPTAAPMAAMDGAGNAAAAPMPPQPAEVIVDQIVEAYEVNAENENALFADTSYEEQAYRSDDQPALLAHWAGEDDGKQARRQETERMVAVYFDQLERSLSGASEQQREALARFGSTARSASADRQLAIDFANKNFREDLLVIIQGGSADTSDISALAAQYRADVHSITDNFKAKIGPARAAFRNILSR